MASDDPRAAAFEQAVGRIDNYLGNGGLWNPELMDHDKVQRLLLDIRSLLLKAAPPAEGPTNRPQPINYAARDRPELIALNSAGLNPAQLQAAKDWAADDRLWTTQETVEFNLLTFARDVLSKAEGPTWQPIETAPKDVQRMLVSADGGVWIELSGQEPGQATHWMPLPTPPRDTAGKE